MREAKSKNETHEITDSSATLYTLIVTRNFVKTLFVLIIIPISNLTINKYF